MLANFLRQIMRANDFDTVKRIVQEDPRLLNPCLVIAAGFDRTQIVEWLLVKNANPSAVFDLTTSLYLACQYNSLDIVRLLIAAGADVNGHQFKGRYTPLFVAAKEGHREAVQLLLAANANINTKGTWLRRTPLVAAYEGGHEDIVKLLLANGAEEVDECAICLDAMKQDMAGLDSCCHRFHNQCLVSLLQSGSNKCPLCRAEFSATFNDHHHTVNINDATAVGKFFERFGFNLNNSSVHVKR
jgi:ankyrin repeat protein